MLGFNAKRRNKTIIKMFDDKAGGFYPLIPHVNVWQDHQKTIKAGYFDPVAVVSPIAGTYGDLIVHDMSARPILVKMPSLYGIIPPYLYFPGDKAMTIQGVTIEEHTHIFIKGIISSADSADGGTLFSCMDYDSHKGMGIRYSRSENNYYIVSFSETFNPIVAFQTHVNIKKVWTTFTTSNSIITREDGDGKTSFGNDTYSGYPVVNKEFLLGASHDGTNLISHWDGYIGGLIIINGINDNNFETFEQRI